MSSRDLVLQFFYFFFYVALQVLLVQNLVVFNVGFSFVYVAFLLLLPIEISAVLLLLIAFLTGLIVDIFYNTLGIHTAACVLLAYLRPYVIRLITPRGGYEQTIRLSLHGMGADWFLPYTLILVFIHHSLLFLIEASHLDLLLLTFLKVICSTVFTTVLIVIFQYLLHSPKKSRL
jgi:hypothetical protein